MTAYETVIGLEVHVELATNSKIFCSCTNDSSREANENVCPACAGGGARGYGSRSGSAVYPARSGRGERRPASSSETFQLSAGTVHHTRAPR